MQRFVRKFGQKTGNGSAKLDFKGSEYSYFNLSKLGDPRVSHLPFSIRVLLENCLRNQDGLVFTPETTDSILDWAQKSTQGCEVPFKPARVLLQDFTGVPAVVDLAAMRDTQKKLGGDPSTINPLCPVDLVVDHSIQADVSGVSDAKKKNEEIEFNRNKERFQFLKWGQSSFNNFRIVPPGNGIVHQVNLEYLAKVMFNQNGTLYPDSVIGTDSHTTMINGLGVVGWGVGGLEAEAVMLGQHVSMVLPEVVGFKLNGKLKSHVTATDLVLTIVQTLRKRGVVGKFVEFFGQGVENLTVEDRSTIANMGPEYGATIGYFPVDAKSLDYLKRTGRNSDQVELINQYYTSSGLMRNYKESENDGIIFSGDILELDLSTVEPCIAGPKRPHDRVTLSSVKSDFGNCMQSPNGFKGFGVDHSKPSSADFTFKDKDYTLRHGDVVISAITSCTNTSNPGVLISAGLLARNANKIGLKIKPYIKTTLSPGSGVVEAYLNAAGLMKNFESMGYNVTGLGCMTCIGNSGELPVEVSKTISDNDLVATAVLSGNRNFEGRVHPLTKANYLASPPLCVAYAIAGTVDIDFEKEPIGKDNNGENVFLKDIWPHSNEVMEVISKCINSELFKSNYSNINHVNELWNTLDAPASETYSWEEKNTYIKRPPFFDGLQIEPSKVKDIHNAYCLLNLGDSITTDHISPAGKIAANSSAASYLSSLGVDSIDYNTYGARRGNYEIMARGTFANIRLINKLVSQVGPRTIHIPSGEEKLIFDAAQLYMQKGQDTIILAGQEYGSGSSRDWAAKGPYLQGVRAVIAQSFERIHRSNLIGMGVLPLEFLKGQSADALGLTGKEQFNIPLEGGALECRDIVTVTTSTGKSFDVLVRLDTPIEVQYYQHGGILNYVLRKIAKQNIK